MEVDFIQQPQGRVLQAYSDCNARVILIRGPLGSGKTVQSIIKIFDYMCDQAPNANGVRPTRWLAVRNTYGELYSTTIRDWMEVFNGLGVFKHGSREPPGQKISFSLPDKTRVESEVMFISFDRPDDVRKAKGTQFTGVWLNEISELSKSVVDMLDLRHGRYPSKKEGVTPTWHGMIGDYNSPDDDHWLYKLAEEVHPDGWAFFAQPGGVRKDKDGDWVLNLEAENLKNLPHDYYLAGMAGKSEDWIKVFFANEYGFVQQGKPVHPRYVDSVHCRHMPGFQPSRDRKIVLGFDFGRTPACAFLQQNEFGGWICFDEFLADDMSAVSFAPELSQYISTHYRGGYEFVGWGDPSGGNRGQATDDTAIKILNDHNIPCRPTRTNDVLIRRSALENPMKEIAMNGDPRFIVLSKCVKIRKGLSGGFHYRRVQVAGDERYHDEPEKNEYSHPVEALEYALQGEGEGRDIKKAKKSVYDDWATPINA